MKKIYNFFGSLSKRKMLTLFAVLAMAGAGTLQAQTDIARYRFAKTTGTFTPITGGTVLVAAGVNYDDVNSAAITIPAFSFGGATITTVYVNSNGYVTFGAAHATSEYTPLSSSGTNITGVVSALGVDNGYGSGNGTTGASSEIRYEQVGTEFVAQFRDVKRWNSTNERISFQIRLNSANGEITIIYGGPIVIGSSTASPQIGIRGNSTTWSGNVNNLRSLDVPAGTTCSWDDAVTANAVDAGFSMVSTNTAVAPTIGLTYTWTPATAVAPVRTFTAVTNITAGGATINWTAPTGATQYNVQYRVPGTCTWTNFAGNPVTGNAAVLTGLAAGTYQVRVRSSDGTNNAIWSHIPNAAGTGDGYSTTATFTTACGVPAPGATIASATSNLCAGASVSFSLTNQTTGTGVTYQWQLSADNVTYTNISGATTNTYNGGATAKFYRCMVKCATGPDSTASAPVQLNFTNNVVTTTPAQRCGNGTVTLAATGSAGTTLRWYTAPTGGAIVATSSPFTTPVINTTTPYYVSAEVLSAGEGAVGTATTLTGATSYPTAFMNRHTQYWLQMVFTVAELNAAGLTAGNITGLKFNTTTIGDAPNVSNFTVMLGPTGNTTLSGFTTSSLTQVYGPSTYSQAIGINTITFSTPYPWDGASNIIVDIRQSGIDNINNAITYYTATTGNTVVYAFTSAATPSIYATTTAATTSTSRLNTTFIGQLSCASPRIPVTATVNTPPTFTVTPNLTICNNAITQLSVTSPTANFNTYTWSPVTNLYTDPAATVAYVAGASATTVYFKSATPGATTYTVNANNTTTQCAAVATSVMTVLPASATATATPENICISGTATLNLTPATGYGAAGFQWQSATDNISFGNETTNATAQNFTTPTLTATKYYRVVVKNSSGVTCFNSTSDTARVNNPTVAGTTPGTRCGPGVVNLVATVNTGATTAWYTAATGGSAVATGAAYAPSVTATTNYWVAARMPGIGSASTTMIGTGTSLTTATEELTAFCNRRINYRMQMIFTVAELNAAGIGAGNLTSIGFNITTLGDAAGNNNYTVKIGTTASSTFTTYITTGLSTVYGPSTYTHAVGLNTLNFTTPFPWDGLSNIVVEITHDGIDQINNATTYYTTTTNNMAGYSFNSSTTATTTTKRFNTTFGYTLPCESPRQQVIATVNPLPAIAVTPNGTVQICAGSTTTLTATGGGNYQWRNASGNIGGQTTNTFTTGTGGVYKVVVTNPVTNCFDSSAAITVNVNPAPVVNLGNDTTFCSGNSLILNAGNTGSTYLWNNGSTNQTRTASTTGTYSVKVTNTSNCSKNDTIQVTVNPTPVVALGPDTTLCQGVNYVLNAGNPAAAKLWDNGTTAQTRTVNASGTYYVRVTNSFNCIARDTVTTTYMPAPVVNLGPDVDACAGDTVTLNAGNPTATFLWDNGSIEQFRQVTTTGNYYVVASNEAANCKGRDTVLVTVHPLPVVNLGNDTTFCHGNVLVLNAGNPGASYLWNDNTVAQTHNVTSTGNYGVVVTDIYSCVGSDDINVLVKELPSGIINAVHGDTATYTFNILNPQYITNYTWNFGDGTPLVNGPWVQHRYALNGIYTVSVKLNGECEDSTLLARTLDVYDGTGTTGIIQTGDSKELVLYPNPAKDLVVIENKLNLKMKHVTVYNVVGQVLSDTKADSEDKHKLHTGTFAAGIYTVRIETQKGIVIRKFEIMK